MMWRHLTTFGSLGITLSAILTCELSFAQLVQVGPGYVKAPFVRIYTDPAGGTHVRAPFTSVYTPGFRPVVPPPGFFLPPPHDVRRFGFPLPIPDVRPFRSPQPTPAQPLDLQSRDMDWQSLRRLAREGAAQLNQELSRESAPQSWRDYLQPAAIAELVAKHRNEPPAEDVRQQLEELLRLYDATVNSSNLRSIHGRPGFRKVHAALKELVRTPLSVQRRLVASARQLQRELSTLGSKGEDWASHLELSSPIFKDDTYDPGADSGDVELEQLAEIIARFDAVSGDPKFTRISALAGFRATHENLIEYRDMRSQDLDGEIEPGDLDGELQPDDLGLELEPDNFDDEVPPREVEDEVQPRDESGIEPIPLPVEELPTPVPNESTAPNESKAPNELRRLRL